MKKLVLGLLAASVAVMVSVARAEEAAAPAKDAAKPADAKVTTVYACAKCEMGALKEGKCEKCGADLQKSKVLAINDGKATVCTCAVECDKCTVNKDDAKKCTCGKDVSTVTVKGLEEKKAE